MIKKRRISYLILLVLIILTSCKKPTESGILEVQGMTSMTYALPVSGNSCLDDVSDSSLSLGEVYADFGKLKYTWKGTKPLEIRYIHVSLRGGGLANGKFEFPIPPDELALIIASSPIPIPGVATPDVGVPYTTACSIRVGGIGFTDITKRTTASGTITVFGLETDADGQSIPVSADTPISIEFMGKPQ